MIKRRKEMFSADTGSETKMGVGRVLGAGPGREGVPQGETGG